MTDRNCNAELCPRWPGEGCVRGVEDCPPLEPGCARGCLKGECYCSEPLWAEMNGLCPGGCGGTGECYCGEA